MCGIAGVLNLRTSDPIAEGTIRRMLAMIRHRGPDQFGIYLDEEVGLGSARLSIIDLSTGQQPIANEDETLWIVFNGEIFNYVELRPELEARGHRFKTTSDTEVLLHLYEEFGPECLSRLNGQFAFAIWNTRDRSLFLARDRAGIRPLFYTQAKGALIFGSEIKALLGDPRVEAKIDPLALDEVFTYWSPLSPHSVFQGISQVPPGHYLIARNGEISLKRYWQVNYPGATEPAKAEDSLEELRSLLIDATRIRLRADVPVGAYLSGGLDSSITASIIRKYTSNRLDTFSISFSDPRFDESEFQRKMADFLGTSHQVVYTTHEDIGRVFPDVIWHTEAPVTRTAPAPMFLLSELVRKNGFKVVLTGEGADEFLAGYDIFKEAAVRRFWARQPNSKSRPRLLSRLYPDVFGASGTNESYLQAFFADGLTDVNNPAYSHAIRWRNNLRNRRFFSAEVKSLLRKSAAEVDYPEGFMSWAPLERSQYLECTIFLPQYLLSSQGDRVGMAHSVEGRFPFLDYRVMEFCNRLHPSLKLRGLTEKYLLKKLGRELVPAEIANRLKRPYRAPIHRCFFGAAQPEYVREMLSPEPIKAAGFFHAPAVSQLTSKIERGQALGETDDMALVGILSTQIVQEKFVEHFSPAAPLSERDDVKVCRRVAASRA